MPPPGGENHVLPRRPRPWRWRSARTDVPCLAPASARISAISFVDSTSTVYRRLPNGPSWSDAWSSSTARSGGTSSKVIEGPRRWLVHRDLNLEADVSGRRRVRQGADRHVLGTKT